MFADAIKSFFLFGTALPTIRATLTEQPSRNPAPTLRQASPDRYDIVDSARGAPAMQSRKHQREGVQVSQDIVVGIDSSTQSTKAIAWDRSGSAVAEGRAPIPAEQPNPGWMEQDPRDWWTAAVTALKALAAEIDPARIAGIAISDQRETVGFFDAGLNALHPAILWLDGRSVDELQPLSDAIGADRLHRITGKPPDVTPSVYSIAWMRRHHPDILDRTARILDVHGYLCARLTGRAVASWTSADPFGTLDIEAKTWSAPILDHLGLTPEQFGELEPPGAHVGTLSESAAAETGLRQGTPVFAAGGDGQCAGLGVDAARPGTVYLNLGTAQITGAWSAGPAISRNWRTMTSPTGEGYFLEGCQRAGTFFVDWFVDTFAGGRGDPAVFARLEAEAAQVPVGAEGAVALPYLSGCMDPHWDPNARAAFLGLGPQHRIAHLYRAVLETLTLETARCVRAMEEFGLGPERIMAVGGGANNALWVQMIADASGLPVTLSQSLEASALGAGMTAAASAGWYPDISTAAAAMSAHGRTISPDTGAREAWAALAERQATAYRPGF